MVWNFPNLDSVSQIQFTRLNLRSRISELKFFFSSSLRRFIRSWSTYCQHSVLNLLVGFSFALRVGLAWLGLVPKQSLAVFVVLFVRVEFCWF